MSKLCNLDGVVMREEEARVPVLDRGFLFGDSVYEVMKTRDTVPFGWIEHLERLRASADGIALTLELDDEAIMRRVKKTLLAVDHGESYIRIIVTRGVGTAPNIDLRCAPGPATWVIMVRELAPPPTDPASLTIVPRLRTDRRALDPAIKSGNYLNNVLGLAEARQRGATDCLFLNQEGRVTEASTSNFYVVQGGRVSTPPLAAGLLSGITRRLLFEYAAKIGLPLIERDLTEQDVRSADELFLSSSLKDVYPVTSLDGRPVGDGMPGALTRQIQLGFAEFCARKTREVYAPRYTAL